MRCSSDDMDGPVEDIGSRSCVTRFVKTLLSIMEHGVKPHSKHLTEYFAFLYEFAKMGEEEVSRSVLVMKPKLKNCLLNLTGMNLLTKKIPKQAGLTIRSNVKRNQRKNSKQAHFLFLSASRASSYCPCKPFQSWSTSTWELKVPTT